MYFEPSPQEASHQVAQLQSVTAALPNCATRLSALLDTLDSAVVRPEESKLVGRLRYRAYLAAGAVDEDASGCIWEASDSDRNARAFAVMLDGRPLASIRVHVVRVASESSPACLVFPDTTAPWLAQGQAIIDSSCFCVEPALARRFPQLALVAVRIPVILAQAFAPSWLIATPRKGHEGFYLRNFGGRRLAEPRAYPGRTRKLALVGNRIERITERIFSRYPAFRAGESELEQMRALYGGSVQ